MDGFAAIILAFVLIGIASDGIEVVWGALNEKGRNHLDLLFGLALVLTGLLGFIGMVAYLAISILFHFWGLAWPG